MLGEGLEPLTKQLGVHFADLRAGELDLPHQEGPARYVERDPGQRLVHWQIGRAIAGDARLVAERLGHRLAERDARILGGVVVVDMQVALGLQRDVDQRVARELLDHVIEETDPGLDVIRTRTVEIDGCGDRRLLGLAVDRGLAGRAVFVSLLHGGETNVRLLAIRFRTARLYASRAASAIRALTPPMLEQARFPHDIA